MAHTHGTESQPAYEPPRDPDDEPLFDDARDGDDDRDDDDFDEERFEILSDDDLAYIDDDLAAMEGPDA